MALTVGLITSEFITEANFDGGLATYCYRVAKGLQSLGQDPRILILSDRDAQFLYEGLPIQRLNVMPRTTWCPAYLRNLIKIPILGRHLRRKLENLHRQSPFSLLQYPHFLGLAAYQVPGLPAVVRLSSHTGMAYAAGSYGESKVEIAQQIFFERRGLVRARAVFAPSRIVAGKVTAEIGRPVKVIESPFIPPQMEEDCSVVDKVLVGRRYCLFFGNLSPIKGIEVLGRALPSILERHRDLHMVFVGKQFFTTQGDPVMPWLKKMAGPYGDRLIYLGPRRHPQLFPLIRRAELVVLPSLADNFPNSCVEAMALGKIVVGTRGNGFEQLIDHRESGLLVAINHVEELFQAIDIGLGLDADTKLAWGLAAQARVAQLRPEVAVGELLQFYREILAQ